MPWLSLVLVNRFDQLFASISSSAIFNLKFFKTQTRIFGHYKTFLKTWLSSLTIRILVSHFQRSHRIGWSSHRCRHRWLSWLDEYRSWSPFSRFDPWISDKGWSIDQKGGTQGAQKVGKNQNAIQADLTSFAQLPEVLEHFRCFWQGVDWEYSRPRFVYEVYKHFWKSLKN